MLIKLGTPKYFSYLACLGMKIYGRVNRVKVGKPCRIPKERRRIGGLDRKFRVFDLANCQSDDLPTRGFKFKVFFGQGHGG